MPQPDPQEITHTLQLQSTVKSNGEFEIFAITAGEGNGWNFTSDALRSSLPLWQNIECFIDHDWFSRSLRDLAGLCHTPTWDADSEGIQLQLKPIGPSSVLLSELGRQVLAEDPPPNVGFSADVMFTAKGNDVETILRVNSLDLVFDPARGGAFKRALNSVYPTKENSMTKPTPPTTPPVDISTDESPPVLSQLEQDRHAVRTLLDEQKRMSVLDQEAAEARKVRAEMCSHLLTSALSTSSLPVPVQDRVRSQFAGRVFDPPELTQAIDDAQQMVSELTANAVVQGPGRIHSMFNTDDKLQAAVDDLMGAPRDEASTQLQVERLSGIRELYMMLTGDRDLHGGYHKDRIQLATTADFTGLVKNAMNKIVINTWDELGKAGYDWWTKISTVEHFNSTKTITGTLVGTVGSLPTVAEGGAYTELAVGDSPETADFTKYGGYVPLTLELIDQDDARKLRAYPRELAAAGLRKISALVSALFTDNAGVGPTMADTGALFNATAVTTAGGHLNLLTTALAAAEWDVVSTAVYNQPMLVKQAATYYGTGPKMALNPKFAVVPRSLQLAAMKILYPSLENAANIYSENQQRGQPGDVVVVPEWTDANDWAAVCDPRLAPAIYVGERFGIMPEIFMSSSENAGAVFTNDEHRLKVRHFLAVWVNDFRPLHKSNVA
jgi:hypothetical protein